MLNPDLIILTQESAAHTRQAYKGMQTSIEMCSILATSEHLVQQECTECNHCVHLSILHIQMCAKSRSNHTHTRKCCTHSTSLQRYANINRNVQYFYYLFIICISFMNIISIKYNCYTSVNSNILLLFENKYRSTGDIVIIDVEATAAMQARRPGEAEPRTPAARAETVGRWRKGRGGR